MKMKITLSGGFHNSDSITILVDREHWDSCIGNSIGFTLQNIATKNQLKRLEKHFCGIDGCCCGSYMRART